MESVDLLTQSYWTICALLLLLPVGAVALCAVKPDFNICHVWKVNRLAEYLSFNYKKRKQKSYRKTIGMQVGSPRLFLREMTTVHRCCHKLASEVGDKELLESQCHLIPIVVNHHSWAAERW